MRWAKISEVIENALKKQQPEHSEYLTEVCSDDTALRQKIESLLSLQGGIDQIV